MRYTVQCFTISDTGKRVCACRDSMCRGCALGEGVVWVDELPPIYASNSNAGKNRKKNKKHFKRLLDSPTTYKTLII